MNMLAMSAGCERTDAGLHDLFERAGVEVEQIVATPSRLSMVVGRPASG